MSKSILETLLSAATTKRKSTKRRKKSSASSVEIPGLGKVPASTVKKWAPTIGGLVLGRMLTRSSRGSSSSRKRRASTAAEPASSDAAPPPAAAGNPWTKWLILFFIVALVVWWLADGGAKRLAELSSPPAEEAVEQVETPAETPAPKKAARSAKKKAARSEKAAARPAASAPKSPEVLTDGLWWEGSGVVTKVLPDDTETPRHQRFFLRDDRGRSLFFAHNIDTAPRVPDLRAGDVLSFRGEWRDNDRGGAMHWTHRDDSGRRAGGWLERDGVRYE